MQPSRINMQYKLYDSLTAANIRIIDLEMTLRWLQHQCSRVEWPQLDGETPLRVAKILQEVITDKTDGK